MNEFKFIFTLDREGLEDRIKDILKAEELEYSNAQIEEIINYVISQQDSWGEAIETPVDHMVDSLLDDVIGNGAWQDNSYEEI